MELSEVVVALLVEWFHLEPEHFNRKTKNVETKARNGPSQKKQKTWRSNLAADAKLILRPRCFNYNMMLKWPRPLNSYDFTG